MRRRTGRAELNDHSLGVETSEIEVSLELGNRDKADFLAALRRELSLIPGLVIVILFGLSSSMILNMAVVPTLYLRYGRLVGSGGSP